MNKSFNKFILIHSNPKSNIKQSRYNFKDATFTTFKHLDIKILILSSNLTLYFVPTTLQKLLLPRSFKVSQLKKSKWPHFCC